MLALGKQAVAGEILRRGVLRDGDEGIQAGADVGYADDGVHGGADVVAHIGQEAAFGGVGFLRPGNGGLELLAGGIQHLPQGFRGHVVPADGEQPEPFSRGTRQKDSSVWASP